MQKNKKYIQYLGFLVLAILLVLIQVLALPDIKIIKTAIARGFGSFMIHAIIVLGYYILLGYGGLASLGTAGFVGLGTYLTGYFLQSAGLSPLLVLLLVILAGVILGLVVGFISLRIEGMYLAIVTLGLSEMLTVLFKNATGFTGGVSGLNIFTTEVKLLGFINLNRENTYYFMAFMFVLLLILAYNLTKSPVGRAMLSMKNSESAAQSMGVGSLKYKLLSFIVATVFAMIAGYLYMLYYRYSEPTKWSLNLSLNVLASVVIGGTGTVWGIILGAYLVFSLNDTLLSNIDFFQKNPNAFIFLTGALMILVVMFYPGGISQLILTIKYKIKKLFNKNKDIGEPPKAKASKLVTSIKRFFAKFKKKESLKGESTDE